jgi:death on curing protein
MIDIEDIMNAHDEMLRLHGGSFGLRDKGLLLSALERPFGGFGETEFYASWEEKSAALVESLVKNHPFMDGNKRTGLFAMHSLLCFGGKELSATDDELYDFVVKIASGEMDYRDILQWIKERVVIT